MHSSPLKYVFLPPVAGRGPIRSIPIKFWSYVVVIQIDLNLDTDSETWDSFICIWVSMQYNDLNYS